MADVSGKGDIRARCVICTKFAVTAYVFRKTKTREWTRPYPVCLYHRRSVSTEIDWYPHLPMGRVGVSGYAAWIQLRRAVGEATALKVWQKRIKSMLTEILLPRGPETDPNEDDIEL